jgi:hypothetical protein
MSRRIHIENATRRPFISRAASAIAASGLFGGAPCAAEARFVWETSEWKLAEFRKLVNEPARVKQLFDAVQIADDAALNSVKNSLNGVILTCPHWRPCLSSQHSDYSFSIASEMFSVRVYSVWSDWETEKWRR